MFRLCYALYQLCAFVLSLVLVPFFAMHQRGRVRLLERIGVWNLPSADYVWFHGASVGELNGLRPVLEAVRSQFPDQKILLTATSGPALAAFCKAVDEVRVLPFDSCVWLRSAIGTAHINALIIAETELWPGLIQVASKQAVPIYLINAVLSDYSWPWYRQLHFFVGPILTKFRAILVAGQVSAMRLRELGVHPDRVLVTGNTKYALPIPETRGRAAKIFAVDRPVLVLGSVRPGEGEIWLDAIEQELRLGSYNLILAPRHQERFNYFAVELKRRGLAYRRRSEANFSHPILEQILLLDTIGELSHFYAYAALAFVGGSLVDEGGHNPLEPAAYGVPVCCGPFTRNVTEVVERLQKAGALRVVQSQDDIRQCVLEWAGTSAGASAGLLSQQIWREYAAIGNRIVGTLMDMGLRDALSGARSREVTV
ncbi:MAG: hypothetical protein K1X79_14020 [Oligoflexia bacterium]|nr:hypothetical protein [Oligoflexia bacterium]